MLYVYKSNQMENLMEALVSVINVPHDNPLLPEWIGIQSRGLKQWIDVQIARRFSVCANIEYLFPMDMVEQFLVLQGLEKKIPAGFEENILTYQLFEILSATNRDRELQEIFQYTKGDAEGIRLFGLCEKLAHLFDNYQIYRPEMLRQWESKEKPEIENHLEKDVQWQAHLYRLLLKHMGRIPFDDRLQRFMNDLTQQSDLLNLPCPRISLFGISSLPRILMRFFSVLSTWIDIHLFILTPSREFFGYIKSEKEKSIAVSRNENHETALEDFYFESGNPLLASLGTINREFHLFLENFDYFEPHDHLYADPLEVSENMLSVIQSDILNLCHRKMGQEIPPVKIGKEDFSISIHSCHTPMREAQVLKDWLLNLFESDPDLCPHDVIVMMPDVEHYAPYIVSVFGMETTIPFVICDRAKVAQYEVVDAFLNLLELKQGRFELHPILDLLSSESITGKFDLSSNEIDSIRRAAEASGILWGMNPGHRQEAGMPPNMENTFEFGLNRMMLGYAMPEANSTLIRGTVSSKSPEGLEARVLGKFALFCDCLMSTLKKWSGKKPVGEWIKIFKESLHLIFDRNYENEEQYLFVMQVLQDIAGDAEEAEIETSFSFRVMKEILENAFAKSISIGSFMSGRVTICNIMPMKSTPFKVVVLMGMQAAAFPRRLYQESFNLIKKYPRPGDKNERDEDRSLFLESILSARQYFAVTYTGRDIKDNSELPPSSVVEELTDVIKDSFDFQGLPPFYDHPLHPFSEAYYVDGVDNHLFSYSKAHCQIALSFQEDRITGHDEFFRTPLDLEEEFGGVVSIDELIRFFSMPLEYFMKNILGIRFAEDAVQVDDREPHLLDPLQTYDIGSFLVENSIQDAGHLDSYALIKAMGKLPYGEKGRLEYNELVQTVLPIIDTALPYIKETFPQPCEIDIKINRVHLTGSLKDFTQKGRINLTYGRLTPKRLIREWISHLALACTHHKEPFNTSTIIGRDTKQANKASVARFYGLEHDAADLLAGLLDIYKTGRHRPYIFFPKTSWHFAEYFLTTNQQLGIDNIKNVQNRCARHWYDAYKQIGERTNRYAALYFEKRDLFESPQNLLDTGFARNAIDFFKPLMENLKIE